jgi:hypothetical protein
MRPGKRIFTSGDVVAVRIGPRELRCSSAVFASEISVVPAYSKCFARLRTIHASFLLTTSAKSKK